MDYKTHLTNVAALEKDLRAIPNPNAHDRDALTRCVTLQRSLNQSVAAQAETAATVEDANAQIATALAGVTKAKK